MPALVILSVMMLNSTHRMEKSVAEMLEINRVCEYG